MIIAYLNTFTVVMFGSLVVVKLKVVSLSLKINGKGTITFGEKIHVFALTLLSLETVVLIVDNLP